MNGNPITLNFWVMPNAGFTTHKILNSEIRKFQKLHPSYDIRLSIHPWSKSWDALMSFVKNKKNAHAPDIVQIGSTWSGTLAYLGILKNITDSFTIQSRKLFVRHALESAYYPGTDQLYSIPWFLDVRVLYYRADLMRMIGKKPSDLETWEGFLDVCNALKSRFKKEHDVYPLRLSGQKASVQIHDIAPWIWSAGGGFLAGGEGEGNTAAGFAEQKALSGIQWYFDLIQSGIIPIMSEEGILPPGGFFTGEYAMQFSGIWPLQILNDPRNPDYRPAVAKNYRAAMFPAGPAGRWTFFGGSNLAVTSFCSYPAEALEFIQFLVSSDAQERHSTAIGMFPSLKSAFDNMVLLKPEIGKVFRESLQHARSMPSVLTLGTIEQIISATTDHILKLMLTKKYTHTRLKEEIQRAAREADYILSLYET